MAYKDKEKEKAHYKKYRELNKERIKECNRQYRELHPRTTEQRNNYFRQFRYGLSPDKYQLLIIKQRGLCAICGKAPKSSRGFHIDHNHLTNKVRGLLCAGCNRSIAGLDNKAWLERAKVYLEENS